MLDLAGSRLSSFKGSSHLINHCVIVGSILIFFKGVVHYTLSISLKPYEFYENFPLTSFGLYNSNALQFSKHWHPNLK